MRCRNKRHICHNPEPQAPSSEIGIDVSMQSTTVPSIWDSTSGRPGCNEIVFIKTLRLSFAPASLQSEYCWNYAIACGIVAR